MPGWQALHLELEPKGLTVVTVALDVDPAHTYSWIDAASPTHPSLIDTTHVTGELFGFVNIPMAVWIDESGTLVRPAESASIERSPLRDMDIPEGLPERMTRMFTEVKNIPDDAAAYRSAIVDWVERGSESRSRSPPTRWWRDRSHGATTRLVPPPASSSASIFGEPSDRKRRCRGGARPTVCTPAIGRTSARPGRSSPRPRAPSANDLVQDANDVYEGNWLDDVIAGGGGAAYTVHGLRSRAAAFHWWNTSGGTVSWSCVSQ